MPELSKEIIGLLGYLLPGFVSAWVFYSLTSSPKPSQFERVIQALIFTFVVNSVASIVEWALLFLGKSFVALRLWDQQAELVAKFFISVVFGILCAYYTNNDAIHRWFRSVGLTTRTSYPSEWASVFSKKVMYVVLQLHDGRRLLGWPKEWPIDSTSGHFYVMQPSWIDEAGKETLLSTLDGVLISAKDVSWVEFLGDRDDSANS